ncbi:hypothetical protein V1291_005711 [Nitrobacteraceae bacterium AZCC 1564]
MDLLRRKSFSIGLGIFAAVAAGSLVAGQTIQAPATQNKPRALQDAAAETTGSVPPSTDAVKPVDAAKPAEAPKPSSADQNSANTSQSSETPAPLQLSPAEQKAAEAKAALDRLLAEASALKASYEDYKRGRSKTPVSLSAFRSMELRLMMAAAADPTNTKAREMAGAMRMAQFEILRPSVQIAAIANRQLYAHAMAERMRDDGMQVEVSGRDNSIVRFVSPQMTKQMAMQLADSAKISEQAKSLQFSRVVFSNGRRSWTYNVRRGRFR